MALRLSRPLYFWRSGALRNVIYVFVHYYLAQNSYSLTYLQVIIFQKSVTIDGGRKYRIIQNYLNYSHAFLYTRYIVTQ